MAKNQIITVYFKGIEVGRIGYDEERIQSTFQYAPSFLKEDTFLNLFPYRVRRVKNAQLFRHSDTTFFRGLPPFIADSLPDNFGNRVFKEWMDSQGKASISPMEQLAYVGKRGMGALEFEPSKTLKQKSSIDLTEIIEITRQVMDTKLAVEEKNMSDEALYNIFKVGTSAGGMRPKILVAENKKTGKLVPGDLVTSADYRHYIIKLGIETEPFSKEKLEFVYYQLAKECGLKMMPSKLINERHFATERFDRQNGEKQHILTASGMTGWNYKAAEDSSYENLFKLAIDIDIDFSSLQELFRRMVFNVVFANRDDHLKNFSFIFDEKLKKWDIAPAYDLTFSLNPLQNFTRVARACSINGKRGKITYEDLLIFAEKFSIKNATAIIENIAEQRNKFRDFAEAQALPEKVIIAIEKQLNEFNIE